MEILITNRLILRGVTSDDADIAKSLVGHLPESGGTWALEHRVHGKVIGMISLEEDAFRPKTARCKMLTVALSEEVWGAGYGKEAAQMVLKQAFLHMDLDLVTARHFPDNDRFKRVLEKCGFTCEGTLRRAAALPNGEIGDVVCYSILREEFKSMPVTRSRTS